MDLTKCHCKSPGFCPIFNRTMGTNPPDWRWCQRTNTEDRQSFYNILSKAPPPAKKKLAELIVEFKDDPQKLFLYYLTQHNRHHRCSLAATEQQKKNLKILNYFDNQSKLNDSFDNVEIRMSYCSPFILLCIIGKHKPNTLEISEKYLTFFLLRFSLNKAGRRGILLLIETQSQLSLSDSHHLLNTSRASALSRPNALCSSRGAPIIFMEPLSRKSSRNSKYSCMSILLLPDTGVRFLV